MYCAIYHLVLFVQVVDRGHLVHQLGRCTLEMLHAGSLLHHNILNKLVVSWWVHNEFYHCYRTKLPSPSLDLLYSNWLLMMASSIVDLNFWNSVNVFIWTRLAQLRCLRIVTWNMKWIHCWLSIYLRMLTRMVIKIHYCMICIRR